MAVGPCVPSGIKTDLISMGSQDIILITVYYEIFVFLELCLQEVSKSASIYWLYYNYYQS